MGRLKYCHCVATSTCLLYVEPQSFKVGWRDISDSVDIWLYVARCVSIACNFFRHCLFVCLSLIANCSMSKVNLWTLKHIMTLVINSFL
jgi:hypothetical protein